MTKCCWVDDNTVITSGTDKMANREYSVWDARKIDQKVTGGELPPGVGATHLHMDHEHKILFASYRGEMNIGCFQFTTAHPSNLVFLNNH